MRCSSCGWKVKGSPSVEAESLYRSQRMDASAKMPVFTDRIRRAEARRGFAGGKRPGRSGKLIQIELNAALDGCSGGLRGLLAAKKAAKLIPQDAG